MKKSLSISLVLMVGLLLVGMSRPQMSAEAEIELNSYASTKGKSTAPITIIEYSDYQCPACKHAGFVVDEMLERYGDQIYFIHRSFPLGGHRHGFSSALAAECAKGQDRYWDYHDKLFEQQSVWGKDEIEIDIKKPNNTFSRYAKELGLDVKVFNQCMANSETAKRVRASKQEGVKLQVRSTPTFFINGVRVVGGKSLKARYEEIIRQQLRG